MLARAAPACVRVRVHAQVTLVRMLIHPRTWCCGARAAHALRVQMLQVISSISNMHQLLQSNLQPISKLVRELMAIKGGTDIHEDGCKYEMTSPVAARILWTEPPY
jgi:hypothetical protein